MKYLSVVEHVREAISNDDVCITANYRSHSRFFDGCNFCKALHYLFIRYVPTISYSRGYTLRTCINELLNFILVFEGRNHKSLHLNDITLMNSEIFRSFTLYVYQNKLPKDLPARLKSAIQKVCAHTDEGFPFIRLPKADAVEHEHYEPLTDEARLSLEKYLKHHISRLKQKIEFRSLANKAKPYTKEEILSEIGFVTSEKIYKYSYYMSSFSDDPQKDNFESYSNELRRLMEVVDDEDLRNISKQKNLTIFKEEFLSARKKKYNAFKNRRLINPFSVKNKMDLSKWEPDPARVFKTMYCYGFPFWSPVETISQVFKKNGLPNLSCDAAELIVKKYHYFASSAVEGFSDKTDYVWEIFKMFFPIAIDQAAIVLFLMLQTGWNKETVLALDGDNYLHELTGAVDVDHTLIFSEKNKSQGMNLPYENPKRFAAMSDTKNALSAVNLIKLAKHLSRSFPLAKWRDTSKDNNGFNKLFICLQEKGRNFSQASKFNSVTNKEVWEKGVYDFLENYEIYDSGLRLLKCNDLVPRLRPTWIKYERDAHRSPLSLIALQQGHNRIETTDIYYDSSSLAKQERGSRLRFELGEVLNLYLSGNFVGLLGRRDSELIDFGALTIFSIPGHRRDLWGCANSAKPDFPGHKNIIASDKRCRAIGHCMFCSQIRVLEDSLPFLMHRKEILQLSLDNDLSVTEIIRVEYEAITYVLDEWGYEEDLIRATKYLRQFRSAMPSNFASLSILFED